MSDLLKTVIQDLINDRTDQAQVSIHEYLVSKMQELSGLSEAKKPVRFTPTFKKITSYDEFERLEGDSDQFFETEMDGKTVMVAAGKDGVITGVWYNKAKSGSMSPDFAKSARPKDEESYMEQDTQWPYGD